MTRPAATYRLQLTPGFTLHDAARVAPYVRALGISHLYLSPILEARAGSVHGYDVTDPSRIRRELGGEDGFAAVARAAHSCGLGILLDIVPNHMAASAENPCWRDLLEFGADSPHARTFDLSWRSEPDRRRLLLPVLGDELRRVIDEDQINVACDGGGLVVRYGEQVYPLAPGTYAEVLRAADFPNGAAEFERLAAADGVHGEPDTARRERARAVRDAWLLRHGPPAAELARALDAWNGRPVAERADVLQHVLDRQAYELAFWRRGSHEVGYRRFFDVTDLAGVRVEDPAVYDATHAVTLALLRQGSIDGLRIDHVDGLYDPASYLERLAHADEPAPYIVVEKILAPDESLPPHWPVAGTTGYEFANILGGWFLEPGGWRAARAAYVRFIGRDQPFEDIAYARQRRIIDALFGGELRVLVNALIDISDRTEAGWTAEPLAHALAEVSACLDVYRTYIGGAPVQPADRARIELACDRAARRVPGLDPRLLGWLRSVLLLEIDPAVRDDALVFVRRWQQFTGPVMAKGFEDTALYNDFTLTSANEVGGSPGDPVVTAARLHAFLAHRAEHAPGALSATSTHDTKRSEDVRLRISALTLFPEEWARFLEARSTELGERGPGVPSPPDRVLLFQTLLGTWPEEGPDDAYAERIQAYMVKATREAKSRTSWRDPDPGYEDALTEAVRRALDPAHPAFAELAALAARLTRPATLASLGQTLLKVTAPGVPDFYQGTETWHHALVDPDNRAPIDFDTAARSWESVRATLANPDPDSVRRMLEDAADGRIKMFVTATSLGHRMRHRDLYATGRYTPLAIERDAGDHFAFARSDDRQTAVTVVGRPSARYGGAVGADPGTAVRLPAGMPSRWLDLLTGRRLEASPLRVADVLELLPCALLVPAD